MAAQVKATLAGSLAIVLVVLTFVFTNSYMYTLGRSLVSLRKSRDRENAGSDSDWRISPFNPIAFESDKTTHQNCSVKLLRDKVMLDVYLDTEQVRGEHSKPCSLTYFHQYFQRTKQFYGDGVWYRPDVEFHPHDCWFTNHTYNAASLARNLRKKNISKILTTGDSTARQFHLNMVRLLFPVWTCNVVRQAGDNETDRLAHFAVPGIPKELLHVTRCKGLICHNWYMECHLNESKTILNLEYIAMPRVVDISLTINKHHLDQDDFHEASNKLEYLLKYYFPHHGFPDIWLYKAPLRHEAWWSSERELAIDLSYVLQLLRLYVPRTTKIIFLSDSRECVHRFPVELRLNYESLWRAPRNWKIHQHNQVLYHVLSENDRLLIGDFNTNMLKHSNHTGERKINERSTSSLYDVSNMYAFLDDMKLSCPMVCDYHEDAGHYKDVYYQRLNKYILESVFSD